MCYNNGKRIIKYKRRCAIMQKTSRFYSTDNNKYNDKDLSYLKQTNVFIIYTLQMLIKGKGSTEILERAEAFYSKIKTKGFSAITKTKEMNNYIGKLRFLVLSLENNPKNAKIFMNSPLVKYLMEPIINGYTDEQEESAWDKFVELADSEDKIAQTSPLDACLTCYKKSDRTVPIGLDFTKILDTIVKVDANRQYYLDDKVDEGVAQELLKAAQLQLDLLKSNERFKNSFYIPENENQSEDSDEHN